jgi:hypothetical protein
MSEYKFGGVFNYPKHKSRLLMLGHDIMFNFTKPMPNPFRRFWYWALLGWRWEKISEETKWALKQTRR